MRRFFTIPVTILLACLGFGPAAQAGLNEGEVRTGSELKADTTFQSSEQMALSLVQPSGTALISGSMPSFNLTTSAWMSSSPLSLAAFSSAAVDFYDNIDLDVPGLPSGTPVIIRIAWAIRGDATSSGSPALIVSSRALVSAPGGQKWTRESNNSGEPVTFDQDGRVEFDFFVHTDTPIDGNIKLTAATEAIAYLDSGNLPPNYSASPASNLKLSFLQVASVRTLNGTLLPSWTILSTSMHNYGIGYGQVVATNPAFRIAPSPQDPHFINFSWKSSPLEFYTIESSGDLQTWTPETQVNGDDSVISLNLIKNHKQRYYRLVTTVGSAPPSSALLLPTPIILPSPAGSNFVRLAWPSSIHESYTLQSTPELNQAWTSHPAQAGTGGALFRDVPKSGPRQFFRLLSELHEVVSP